MDNQSFYIELVSNSKSFPENTVANFKNRICLDKELNGNWQMAVVEISYTYSWKNLGSNQWVALNEETYINEENMNSLQHLNYINRIHPISSGHYDNLQVLITEIHNSFNINKTEDITNIPHLHIDNITKHLYIEPGYHKDGQRILPEFSDELSKLLGFDKYSTVNPIYMDGKIISDRPPDINAGLRTLFIYSKHIVPQYIGDIRANILKTVEVPNNLKFGDQVVIKYNNPHYIPILFNNFEIIEIDIRDSTGDRIPFLYGFTLIKLHLRKQ